MKLTKLIADNQELINEVNNLLLLAEIEYKQYLSLTNKLIKIYENKNN